ncbi:cell division protein FtsL, partial [Bacillus atrophaeus]
MSVSKPNLAKLIVIDLFTVGRWPLCLLLMIFATAMGVVFTTHHTRQAIAEKNEAMQQRDYLDNEW